MNPPQTWKFAADVLIALFICKRAKNLSLDNHLPGSATLTENIGSRSNIKI